MDAGVIMGIVFAYIFIAFITGAVYYGYIEDYQTNGSSMFAASALWPITILLLVIYGSVLGIVNGYKSLKKAIKNS